MNEALRLADYMDDALNDPNDVADAVSAELRRLAAVEAQRDALKQTLHDELAGNLRLRDLGGARPDEPMLTFLERIIAERDALLEALRKIAAIENKTVGSDWEEIEEARDTARAAIAAVEEGK